MGLFVKLLPQQIPVFWETIKFVVVQTDEIKVKDRMIYLIKLLHSLLNDKNQCFIRLNKERRLMSLMVTSIDKDKISTENALILRSYYSWMKIDDETWIKDFAFAKDFAIKNNCKQIIFESKNPKIWEAGSRFGFIEKTRVFVVNVEV